MPIYEYRCDNCGHEMEAFQKVSEDPLRRCPSCEADALRKRVSAAAFRLKGGGWYETDFKSGKKRNVSADGGSASDGAAASDGESAKKSGAEGADKGAAKDKDKGSSAGSDASPGKSSTGD